MAARVLIVGDKPKGLWNLGIRARRETTKSRVNDNRNWVELGVFASWPRRGRSVECHKVCVVVLLVPEGRVPFLERPARGGGIVAGGWATRTKMDGVGRRHPRR